MHAKPLWCRRQTASSSLWGGGGHFRPRSAGTSSPDFPSPGLGVNHPSLRLPGQSPLQPPCLFPGIQAGRREDGPSEGRHKTCNSTAATRLPHRPSCAALPTATINKTSTAMPRQPCRMLRYFPPEPDLLYLLPAKGSDISKTRTCGATAYSIDILYLRSASILCVGLDYWAGRFLPSQPPTY